MIYIGNIELYLKFFDWYVYGYDYDWVYDNVIFYVVYYYDWEIFVNGVVLLIFELKDLFDFVYEKFFCLLIFLCVVIFCNNLFGIVFELIFWE